VWGVKFDLNGGAGNGVVIGNLFVWLDLFIA
jgi:hypothetical protein